MRQFQHNLNMPLLYLWNNTWTTDNIKLHSECDKTPIHVSVYSFNFFHHFLNSSSSTHVLHTSLSLFL